MYSNIIFKRFDKSLYYSIKGHTTQKQSFENIRNVSNLNLLSSSIEEYALKKFHQPFLSNETSEC